MCDDFWELEDAHTVCRQLGFLEALNATVHGVYGPGSGPIWLDNVKDFVYTPSSELHFHCAKRVWEFQTAPELPNAAPVDLQELHELCLLSRTAYGC